jgi:CRP-like cAMP-binding protein
MLKLKIPFERLMKLLRSINPQIELPDALEPFLWQCMEEITTSHHEVLVDQGAIPKYAYFIIRGYIYVYYFDKYGNKHVIRFYAEDCIVAFLSFLERTGSPYYIAAGRDTLLSRISAGDMQHIYNTMSGMKEFAQLTVMRYDASKEKLREDMLGLGAKERVREFYSEYPFLLPAENARMDEEIALFLQMSVRTLIRCRNEISDF